MRRILLLSLFFVMGGLAFGRQSAAPAAQPATAASLVGVWRGRINMQGSGWVVVLHVVQDDAGKIVGVIDDLDPSGTPIRTDVILKNGKVHLEVKGITAGYDGKLDDSGDTINGAFEFAGQDIGCTLKRDKPAPPALP